MKGVVSVPRPPAASCTNPCRQCSALSCASIKLYNPDSTWPETSFYSLCSILRWLMCTVSLPNWSYYYPTVAYTFLSSWVSNAQRTETLQWSSMFLVSFYFIFIRYRSFSVPVILFYQPVLLLDISFHIFFIRLFSIPYTIELNYRHQSKMSSSNKLTCKGALQQVFICLRPRTPSPPTHCIRVYNILIQYSHREGEAGGRVEPERRLEWQQFTKLGRK